MKVLCLAINELKLAWWNWARAEIHPLHSDVPRIVTRIRELEARRERASRRMSSAF